MGLFSRRTKAKKLQSLEELVPMVRSGAPVLIDFYQVTCGPCQVMDGIINELADQYGDSAHIVKVDVAKIPAAVPEFRIRSTPTFVLLGPAPVKKSKKARRNGAAGEQEGGRRITQRWRSSGLVKKDQLERVLESNGAVRVGG